jgi:hypothetical protein
LKLMVTSPTRSALVSEILVIAAISIRCAESGGDGHRRQRH